MLRHHHHYIHVAPISTRNHSMSPPANPYKKKPPPSSGSMIIENPYKKQRSHLASGATLTVLNEQQQPSKTHQDNSFVPPSLTVPTRECEHMDPRSVAAWITPRKEFIFRSDCDDGDRLQLAGNTENIIDSWSAVTSANAGKERGNNQDRVPAMFCVTPATNRKANAKDKDENGFDQAIDNDSNNNLGWTMVSVFKVFASGIICVACNNKPIGSGIETVRQHMKACHTCLLLDLGNFSKFYSSIIKAATISSW